MNAHNIKQELISRLSRFCIDFLPGGNSDGHYYRCGSIDGGSGTSFVLNLTGSRAGQFYENNSNDKIGKSGGTILDLYMRKNNISNVYEAIKSAMEWCGISEIERVPTRGVLKQNEEAPSNKIEKRFKVQSVQAGTSAFDYLTIERGIPVEILNRYRVCEGECAFHIDGTWSKLEGIAFQFFVPEKGENKYYGTKYLSLHRHKGSKLITTDKNMKASNQHLWGMSAIPDDAKELVICEGEIDAMSVATLGYNAVSIPFGAKKKDANEWINNDYEWLERFESILVCMDSDEAGVAAAESIIPRLGFERVKNVALKGSNDANEAFMDNPDYLRSALENAEDLMPEKLRRAGYYAEALYYEFYPKDDRALGEKLPFKCDEFRFRAGELTVWSGWSKHGKTVMLSWLVNNFANNYGDKIAIASLELKPVKTLRNLMRQAIASKKPEDENGNFDRHLFKAGVDYLDEHFYLFDLVGRAKVDEVLDAFTFAVKKYGVSHIVIDSVLRLDVGKDDRNRQNEVMNMLSTWAKDYNVHLHLVAHSKKPQGKQSESNYVPKKYDIEGSGDFANIAHNVIVVYRNKKKEDFLAIAEGLMSAPDGETQNKGHMLHDSWISKPDAQFLVRAQREGDGEEPIVSLFYDKESWTYGEKYGFVPQRFSEIEGRFDYEL